MLSLWSCFRHVWQPVLLDRSATRKMSVLTSFTLRSRSVSWPSMPCVRCSLAFFHLWGSSLMASDKAYNLRRFLACQQPRELKQFKTETWGCRWMQVIAIAIRIGLAAHLVYWNALGHFHPHCSVKQTVGRGPTDAEGFLCANFRPQHRLPSSTRHSLVLTMQALHRKWRFHWFLLKFIGLIWFDWDLELPKVKDVPDVPDVLVPALAQEVWSKINDAPSISKGDPETKHVWRTILDTKLSFEVAMQWRESWWPSSWLLHPSAP